MAYFTMELVLFQFCWKNILYPLNITNGITILHFKLCYRAIVKRKHGTYIKPDTQISEIKDPDIKSLATAIDL